MASTASRDQGLARIGSATRWLAAGVLVAGGALSAAVAKTLPGHSGHPAPATASSGSAAPAGGANSSGAAVAPSATDPGAGSASVTAPPQAPQPTYNPPVVNSGGS